MINLDQVRTLEWKVKQAVQLIGHLKKENETLRVRLSDTEVRLQELESLLESFKAAQSEMETGIRSALEELDHLDEPRSDLTSGMTIEAPSEPESEPELVLVTTPVETAIAEDVPPSVPEPVPESSFEAEFAALVEAEERGTADEIEEPVEETPRSEPDQQPGLGIF